MTEREQILRRLLKPAQDIADDMTARGTIDHYLFIGGPADGEWKSLPKDAPTAICPVLDLPGGVGAFHLNEVLYRRQVLQKGKENRIVYVLDGMTLSDATTRLLHNE